MSAMERMTITLPAEVAEALEAVVAGGEYASTGDVVREALHDWIRTRDDERRESEALREAIHAEDSNRPSLPIEKVNAELRSRIERSLSDPRPNLSAEDAEAEMRRFMRLRRNRSEDAAG